MRRDDERRSASAFASVAPPRLEQQYGCGGCFAQGAAAPLAVDALLLLGELSSLTPGPLTVALPEVAAELLRLPPFAAGLRVRV